MHEKQPRTKEIKVVPIGNSRGIRLPKSILDKYAITGTLVLEEREEGILLRGKGKTKLSWTETFKEMARESEDWSDMDNATNDGLKDEHGQW